MLLRLAVGYYIWVILGICCTISCLAESPTCLLSDSSCNPLDLGFDQCHHKLPVTVTENVSILLPDFMHPKSTLVRSLCSSEVAVTSITRMWCENLSCGYLIIKCSTPVTLLPKCRLSNNTSMRGSMPYNSRSPSPYAFSMVVNLMTDASLLHPHGMASLPVPILSHHSSRCGWKSRRSIVMSRNNPRLNMHLPSSLNGPYPLNMHFIEDTTRELELFQQACSMVLTVVPVCLLFGLLMSQMIPPYSKDYMTTKGDQRCIQAVRPKQKTPTAHLSKRNRKSGKSTKMAHESSFSPSLVVSKSSVAIDSSNGELEDAPAVSLSVRNRKDKRRRPKKKKNGVTTTTTTTTTTGITQHMDNAVNNNIENSTDSSNLFKCDTSVTAFPKLERSALDPPVSANAISPVCRAPGPKIKMQKAVEAEENNEDRYRYDIWGDHLSRIALMLRPPDSVPGLSKPMEGVSHSFFVRDPLQTLLTTSVPVTLSIKEG